MTTLHDITVPALFWDDHIERDCTPAEREERKGRRVRLSLSDEALSDLESDAEYYAAMPSYEDFARHNRPIIESAKRTVASVKRYRARTFGKR